MIGKLHSDHQPSQGATPMTATSTHSSQPRSAFTGLTLAVNAIRAWNQRRSDARILSGLSDYQLKDIGYRLPE
jgi:uncharacterized protein YjiS (DUF1127 family)